MQVLPVLMEVVGCVTVEKVGLGVIICFAFCKLAAECCSVLFFVLLVVVVGCYRLLLSVALQFVAFCFLGLFWVAGWLSL